MSCKDRRFWYGLLENACTPVHVSEQNDVQHGWYMIIVSLWKRRLKEASSSVQSLISLYWLCPSTRLTWCTWSEWNPQVLWMLGNAPPMWSHNLLFCIKKEIRFTSTPLYLYITSMIPKKLKACLFLTFGVRNILFTKASSSHQFCRLYLVGGNGPL